MPPGYSLEAGYASEMMGESFSSLGMALVLGVVFMFFVLAAQFESFIHPFTIITRPAAGDHRRHARLAGGAQPDQHHVADRHHHADGAGDQERHPAGRLHQGRAAARGIERSEALIKAGRIRLRPIMMTTLAMILGMTPVALGLGSGAELRAPMADAVIGGLITSTLLTLVVVPAIYTVLDDFQGRIFGKRPGQVLLHQHPAEGG